jgi:4-methyl-5(b-hydroxyethyl)-thiazole monophosphate biosynthesis
MTRVLVPVAQGSEEIEAVTTVDILRRGGVEVVVAGLEEGPVEASRGVVLVPDTTLERALETSYDAVALPGGGPGTERLRDDDRVRDLVRSMAAEGRWVAAICAAPSVLAAAGVLAGRRATGFPGVLEALELPDVDLVAEPVVVDGNIVTSRGPGTAMDFALTLVELLEGAERRREVESKLQRPDR